MAANSPDRIRSVVRRLEAAYGPRPWRKHGSGLAGLVQTILSQNTSDGNSTSAYRSLRARFPTWERMLAAPSHEIERAIRSGGLAKVKTPRIKAALRAVKDATGQLSLRFLSRRPVEEAKQFLESLDGVGPKTAACVLMFCYGRPALPVDTHVHRVARRLQLVPRRSSAERAQQILEAACPPRLVYPFHVLMVAHGRRTCRARRPQCERCALASTCPSRV